MSSSAGNTNAILTPHQDAAASAAVGRFYYSRADQLHDPLQEKLLEVKGCWGGKGCYVVYEARLSGGLRGALLSG
jgi:hypothetical protein